MSKYTPLLDHPSDLETVLSVADVEDLCVLVDYITDEGKGRLALDGDINKKLCACRKHKIFIPADRALIAQEILLFGGNTISNLYRSFFSDKTTISYAELVQDVAQKISASFVENEPVQDIEQAILMRIFMLAFEKMPEDKRKRVLDELGIDRIGALRSIGDRTVVGAAASAAAPMTSLHIATMVASAVSTQTIGRAVFGGTLFGGARGATAAVGISNIAVLGGLWTLADLSNPAYRVTLPCVVQVAYMRQKYLAALNAKA